MVSALGGFQLSRKDINKGNMQMCLTNCTRHNERPPCCSQQGPRRLFTDSMVKKPPPDSRIESSENWH